MKESKLFILTFFSILISVLFLPRTVLAETHNIFGQDNNNTFIVVGNRAFSYGYVQSHSEEIGNQIISDSGSVYYWDGSKPSGSKGLTDLFTDSPADTSYVHNQTIAGVPQTINAITYVDDSGNTRVYTYSNGNYICNDDIYIRQTALLGGGRRSLQITVLKSGLDDTLSGAAFFKVAGYGILEPILDTNSIQYTTQDNSNTITIDILDSRQELIGVGKVTLPDSISSDGYFYQNIAFTSTDNIAGNIINSGVASLSENNYIYYQNTADGNKLYRINTQDKAAVPEQVCDDDVMYITAVRDDNSNDHDYMQKDMIYYSNTTDGYNYKLYRICSDHTGRQKLCDDIVTYPVLYDDYIYYSNQSDGGKLYRVSKNGGTRGTDGLLHGQKLCDDEAEYINVVNDMVYYSDFSEFKKIYCMDINGNDKTCLTNEPAAFLNVSGNYAYYISTNNELHKLQVRNNDGGIVLTSSPQKIQVNYITYNGDGTVGSISDDQVSALNVVGNVIYYKSVSDGGFLYKINTDGTEQQKVMDDNFDFVDVVGDNIYYLKSNALYWLDLSTVASNDPSKKVAGTQVTTVTPKVTIKSIDSTCLTYYTHDGTYTLPLTVTAYMSDGTVQQLPVIWDTDNITSDPNGNKSFNGKVLNYNQTVAYNVVMQTTNTIDTDDHNPTPSTGAGPTITINRGLNNGDIVKVYSDSSGRRQIGTGTASTPSGSTSASVTIQLPPGTSGTVYLSLTSGGRAESELRPYTITSH